MNTNSTPEKTEKIVQGIKRGTTCMTTVTILVMVTICVLLVLFLIYGWQLVYLI